MQDQIHKLLQERYFLEHENSWDDIAKRVSSIYPPSYSLIKEKMFIPSTPTLMNANTNGLRQGTLSSCFTMDIEDSIEGIFDALKEAALVTKASGGVGYMFSQLRSSVELVKSLKRLSSGPVPFMRVFNTMLDAIQQGGVRRGAGMGLFKITHPNILSVIRLKNNKGEMERLNLSIAVTREFYNKLKTAPNSPHMVADVGGDWFELIDKGKVVTTKQVWDEIIEYAWLCAEPGIINIDTAFDQCTVTNLNPVVLTNPCSEFVNIPYASCNLGSLNLTKFIKNGVFDWDMFHKAIVVATRFLNNVIDINVFPLDKIKDVTLQVRPIGLGVMGYAHALYMMDIPFNSEQADAFADAISLDLTMVSMRTSVDIAKETGKSYPAYDEALFIKANDRFFSKTDNQYIQSILADLKIYGIANSCQTSLAPTGSISYIADVSGNIEPVFGLSFYRRIEKLDNTYEEVFISDRFFDEYLEANFDAETKLKILKKVAANDGSCQNIEEIPEEKREVFVTATDLTPMEHLHNLGIIARNTSLSVAKTINLPAHASREEISEVYQKAAELGVIGVTVYRDGCREGILVHNCVDDKEVIVKNNAPKRPKRLPCHVYRVSALNRATNQGEKWVIFVGLLGEDPYEIMAGKITDVDFDHSITEGEMVKVKRDGKNVYQFVHNGEVLVDNVQEAFLNEIREYVTRLMSLALRHGAGIEYLKEVLQKSNGTIVDFNKAVIRAIGKYTKVVASKERCPTCNAELRYESSCIKCSDPTCGYTKCS